MAIADKTPSKGKKEDVTLPQRVGRWIDEANIKYNPAMSDEDRRRAQRKLDGLPEETPQEIAERAKAERNSATDRRSAVELEPKPKKK